MPGLKNGEKGNVKGEMENVLNSVKVKGLNLLHFTFSILYFTFYISVFL